MTDTGPWPKQKQREVALDLLISKTYHPVTADIHHTYTIEEGDADHHVDIITRDIMCSFIPQLFGYRSCRFRLFQDIPRPLHSLPITMSDLLHSSASLTP